MEFSENKMPFVSTRIGIDSYVYSDKPILSAKDAVNLVANQIYDAAKEIGMAIFLDCSMTPICIAQVGQGNEQGSIISARDIAQIALLSNASNVMLIHNHPALIPDERHLKASIDDIKLTDTISKALGLHGIYLVDSIIVSGYMDKWSRVPAFYSMRGHNYQKLVKKTKEEFQNSIAVSETEINWDIPGSDFWNQNVAHQDESFLDKYEFLESEERDR